MARTQQQPPEPASDAQECTTVHNDQPAQDVEAQPRSVFPMHNPAQTPEPYRRPEPKTGRYDMCPCGSGKKYKTLLSRQVLSGRRLTDEPKPGTTIVTRGT